MMNAMMNRQGAGFSGMPGGGISPMHGGPSGSMMDQRNPLTPMHQMAQSQQMGPQSGQLVVPNQSAGRSIPLSLLIDFIVQRTYHELSVLSEL